MRPDPSESKYRTLAKYEGGKILAQTSPRDSTYPGKFRCPHWIFVAQVEIICRIFIVLVVVASQDTLVFD